MPNAGQWPPATIRRQPAHPEYAVATDYLKRNRALLEKLAGENPVKYCSLKRYLECQNIYAETGDWSQAAAHWNAWAERLLAERKKLKKDGKWQAVKGIPFGTVGKNQPTRDWLDAARVDFSDVLFLPKNNKDDADKEKDADDKSHYYVLVKELSFMDFIFPCDASFWNAKLWDNVTFSDATINGDASFREATFGGDAWFLRATFGRRVDFENVKFKGDVNFGDATFGDATFGGYSKFRKAEFSGDAWFEKATFSSLAAFPGATFNREANFLRATFGGDADFEEAEFVKDAVFRSATFAAKAKFGRTRFNGNAVFVDTTFDGIAMFWRTIFNGNAVFRESIFDDKTSFRLAKFKQPATFSSALFRKVVDFTSLNSTKSFSLHGARFGIVPDFNEAVFHAPPVLDDVRVAEQLTEPYWRPFGWRYPFKSVPEPQENARRISRNFRALGKMAHEARDWLNEMEFFAQEIRCQRFGEDFPLPSALAGLFKVVDKVRARWRRFQWRRRFWPFTNAHEVLRHVRPRPCYDARVFGPRAGRFWFGLIYEKLSDFGRSFARPLGWWAGATVFFAVFYALLAKDDDGWSWWDAIYLSVRHALVVGGLVRTGHMEEVIKAMFGSMGSGLALVMMFQTVLSAFFLFFFFLAVRNHFRIR